MSAKLLEMNASCQELVDFCFSMVREIRPSGDTLFQYGAAVDPQSGGCLFVPGIYDTRVLKRLKDHRSNSKDCITAFAKQSDDPYLTFVEIHLRWKNQTAVLFLPRSKSHAPTSLPEISWQVLPEPEFKDVETDPALQRMGKNAAYSRLRYFLEPSDKSSTLFNMNAANFQSNRRHDIVVKGWFIDRDNRDVFVDRFLEVSDNSLKFLDQVEAVREKLTLLSSGRDAVCFAIAKYRNRLLLETKFWSSSNSFWGRTGIGCLIRNWSFGRMG